MIKASIKPSITLAPTRISLKGKAGETKSQVLTISAELDEPLKIKPRASNLDGKVSYTIEEVEEGKRYQITFQNNPEIKGNFDGYLRLITNYKEKPKIDVRINSRFK